MKKFDLKNMHVGVVGLGYVGMPLALALAKHFTVTGYDIHKARVEELQAGTDSNREIRQADLRATSCRFTADSQEIKACNLYIVTVPTPIDDAKNPDLSAIRNASEAIAKLLKAGDIVVYESTVYPGVTEDICGPILEQGSGLRSGQDFFLGYSPERINPGDLEHTVENITKIVAGQTPEVTALLADIYGRMNGGKIYQARDIKTAEAAKAIENAQRDINIAFINEVTMLLNKLGLSAHDVLDAARTKWNFLPFSPGLVGGHCIGVDPYYLAQAALNVGHQPEVILAGRKINDSMGHYIAGRIDRYLNRERGFDAQPAHILILGFTFKENINDIRNTKVIDTIMTLKTLGHHVDVHDPHAAAADVKAHYGIDLIPALPKDRAYDCIALAVGHKIYADMNLSALLPLLNTNDNFKPIVYDIKGLWKSREFPDNISYKTL
jgi:UDP-N-acetyl-D-galactosamine dehydrogenase